MIWTSDEEYLKNIFIKDSIVFWESGTCNLYKCSKGFKHLKVTFRNPSFCKKKVCYIKFFYNHIPILLTEGVQW